VVLESKGYVVPRHQVQVSPKVGGLLIRVNPRFEEGAKFEKDEWLGEIEDIDYKAEYARAVATYKECKHKLEEMENGNRPEEIEQARRQLEENQVQMFDLRRELDSARMVEGKSVSKRTVEQASKEFDAARKANARLTAALKLMELGPRKEAIDQARDRLAQSQADVDKALWRLENCKIKAPIAGTILKKTAEEGNLVNPSAYSNGLSASMCDMADLSDLEVDLNIQERDVSGIVVGQPCWIMPEAFQRYEPFKKQYPRGYSGYVSRLMPIADRSKGAVPVRVKIEVPKDEAGKYLKPEMSALVTFLQKK
jgi:multidrug resistance efflux pump